jgi:hypothetical protein
MKVNLSIFRRTVAATLVSAFLVGCIGPSVSPEESFLDRDYVLSDKDADILEGPYKEKKSSDSNKIVLEFEGRNIELSFRGCRPTGDALLDLRARKHLVFFDGVYVRTDCKQILGTNNWRAVAYHSANAIVEVDKDLNQEKRVLTYVMPQLLNLTYGYALLDTSDTNYPLYEVFREAEQVARENRNGYWATHLE